MKLGLVAKEKGKQKRVDAKRQLYQREIPDFLFAEGLEKKRQSKKKSHREADITCIKTKFPISYFFFLLAASYAMLGAVSNSNTG